MKKFIVFIFLALTLTACHKEGKVTISFCINNNTNGKMEVDFSSWGEYFVSHGDMVVSPHKFHTTEEISAHGKLTMEVTKPDMGDESLPTGIVPAWMYITRINCSRVNVPAEYFQDEHNWKVTRTATLLGGPVIKIELNLTPEVLVELNLNNPDQQ